MKFDVYMKPTRNSSLQPKQLQRRLWGVRSMLLYPLGPLLHPTFSKVISLNSSVLGFEFTVKATFIIQTEKTSV